MTHSGAFPSRTRQAGVATLVVAMVLLIAATFITFFSAKVGVQEQRMSANDYRYKQGFTTGEALLERAKIFLASDRANFASWTWTACTAGQTTLPCGNGTANVFGTGYSWVDVSALDADVVEDLRWTAGDGPYLLTSTTGNSFAPVIVAARGRSDDGLGLSLLRVSQTRFNLLNPGPVPPIMAPNVATGGNLTIIGNPNHDLDTSELTLVDCDNLTGSGQLLSVWAYDPVNFYGSMQTCHRGSYRDPGNNAQCIGQGIADPTTGTVPSWNQCQCEPNANEKSPYSQKGDINDDVVDNDADFPLEPFFYVFGRTKAAVKASADFVLPNCSTLGPASTGLYWITGNCQISAGTVVGSRAAPVVLVSEGNFQFNANSEVWGLVVGADMERNCAGQTNPNLCASASPTDVKINGTFTLHGAMVVEKSIDIGNGTYNALYDPCVFAALGSGTSFDKFGPVAGSWNDRL